MKEDGEFSVGRKRDGGGKIVDGARMAGDLCEKPAVGELDRGLLGESNRREREA